MKKTIDNISKAARRDHRPDVRFDNDKCVSVYACVYVCVRLHMRMHGRMRSYVSKFRDNNRTAHLPFNSFSFSTSLAMDTAMSTFHQLLLSNSYARLAEVWLYFQICIY